jgi:dihydropteroate synthase
MRKYYTRPCNFYYGKNAKRLVYSKKALPLNGKHNIAFDQIEIFSRQKKQIKSNLIYFKNIKKLSKVVKKVVKKDLKNIVSKRSNFLKNVNFSETSIMGVLNLTPDSFSDGGKFNSKKKSFHHILDMIKYGANIIDIGGESTRPGSNTITPQSEWKRIEHVVRNFKKKHKSICLSIDTRKSDIMLRSIKCGADLINDVSGFNFDLRSVSKLKRLGTPKVLHHMQGTPNTMQKNPKYTDVLLDIFDFFEENIHKKFDNKKIILDPGIGFGKNLKHNLTLISKISLFHSLGFPILVGTSRKKFIGYISGKHDSKYRMGGTLASVLFLLSQGVQIFRVHDVKEIKQGILVFEKILLN